MRRELVRTLVEIAAEDERVILLTGDLGYAALEPFAERFPSRFLNVGVAEQNMVGVATGLAEAGFTPYVYSISTFASMRPYEFIRNGPVLHSLPVRIVGIGEGVDYGHNGMTHYALEDLALMRVQPGLTLVAPAASEQVDSVVRAVQTVPGPVYLRISKQSVSIPELSGRFEIGRAQELSAGADVVLLVTGALSESVVAAARILQTSGISAGVTVVSTLNPPPTSDLIAALDGVQLAMSVESHYLNGGLGSLIAEVIAENSLSCRLIRAGVDSPPLGISGGRDYMHEQLGLSAARLADSARQALVVN